MLGKIKDCGNGGDLSRMSFNVNYNRLTLDELYFIVPFVILCDISLSLPLSFLGQWHF